MYTVPSLVENFKLSFGHQKIYVFLQKIFRKEAGVHGPKFKLEPLSLEKALCKVSLKMGLKRLDQKNNI